MAPLPRLAAVVVAVFALTPVAPALAQPAATGAGTGAAPAALPTIAARTAALEKRDGFFPLYWDARRGRLYLEIPRLEEEFLYATSLPWGVGSNDIGLDRQQIGRERLVHFVRSGPRVIMVEKNTAYRADSPDARERRTVEESFARSAIWGFEIEAEDGGRLLVDATAFAVRDAHDAAGALRRTQQGNYGVDLSRSAVHMPRTKAFPRNTEIEVMLTLTGQPAGRYVRDVVPSPEAITIHERHSLIALPPAGYQVRMNDPRTGFFGPSYMDYGTRVGDPMVKRLLSRHRLQKKDPSKAYDDPVQPIVYYVDAGAPEPIRTALVEGARWWNQAFEAAGFRDAFRVEVMPDSVDPMDVRYNVITWVHRATRGWSYGASYTDPRTGEILKGHVTLGSLRARQDYLLGEGLLSPYATGTEKPAAIDSLVLARIRQLSAHEVGHTLGMAHNYIASAQGQGGRASVMDYPHPLVQLDAQGHVDLGNAYATGIGEWDKVAVTLGYGQVAPGADELRVRDSIVDAARRRGLTFLTDQDGRPVSSAHPQVHLWDNGTDAVAELKRVMTVRRAALNKFGTTAVRRGQPLATMEDVLVPLYLHHRYQLEAAVKSVAGVTYAPALRGEGLPRAQEPVPAPVQRAALDAVLEVLSPKELMLPGSILETIPPRPFLVEPTRELFDKWTGMTFDPLAPAMAIADVTFDLLLDDERVARVVAQESQGQGIGGAALFSAVTSRVFSPAGATTPYARAVSQLVQQSYANRLMQLGEGTGNPLVRALARAELHRIADRKPAKTADAATVAFLETLADDIEAYFDGEKPAPKRNERLTVPPGSPIGDMCGMP
jgi:hypothetical protein